MGLKKITNGFSEMGTSEKMLFYGSCLESAHLPS